MNLPDDFGLSPLATLGHVGVLRPVASHFQFWRQWVEAVFAGPARLWPARQVDPSDPTVTHGFESLRSTRIGAMLLEPPPDTPVRAGLVTTHGYGPPPRLAEEAPRWEPLLASGVAVLVIRLRGFAGSRLETGDLTGAPFGWIGHGLQSPAAGATGVCDWVLSGGVADLVNGCRALHEWLRGRGPLFLHGESFGGGLAILAAAQLAGRLEVSRMAIGLPSFGDWPWRLAQRERPCMRGGSGVGVDVNRFLTAHASLEARVAANLRLFDAVVHARAVRCPLLCKLALRDESVPAPTAAAVFNAASTPPGLKRRFVTAYGHFDGGLADLRRHAGFERLLLRYLDPSVEPLESLAAL